MARTHSSLFDQDGDHRWRAPNYDTCSAIVGTDTFFVSEDAVEDSAPDLTRRARGQVGGRRRAAPHLQRDEGHERYAEREVRREHPSAAVNKAARRVFKRWHQGTLRCSCAACRPNT
jgi:hypothetical protein